MYILNYYTKKVVINVFLKYHFSYKTKTAFENRLSDMSSDSFAICEQANQVKLPRSSKLENESRVVNEDYETNLLDYYVYQTA